MSHKKLFLLLLAAVVLVLILGIKHSPSTAAVPAAPSSLGGEIVISERDSNEYGPAIAYNSIHNEYLVVWENMWPGLTHDIYAQRISSTGQLLSWFAVSSSSNNQMNPSVAYDPINDRYLVVWVYDYWGDGSDWDVYGRFIPWSGPDPGMTDFSICNWTSGQAHPVVTYALAQQEFLTVWVNMAPSVPDYLSARRVYADGSGFPDDPFLVSSGAVDRDFPDVTYNLARNEYMVTWDVDVSVSDEDIYGLRLTGTGVYLGTEFVIAGWPDVEERPSVAACNQADQYLVAWQSDQGTGETDFAVYARYLNGDGVLGNVYLFDDSNSPETQVDVSCDATGNRYLLAWQSGHDYPFTGIWATVAYPNEVMDPMFNIVLQGTSEDRGNPAIGGGRANFLVAWEHTRVGGNLDIHGRLVGYGVFLPVVLK
jgi:hypothetical protein